jgi:tripeptide aminopeptidase
MGIPAVTIGGGGSGGGAHRPEEWYDYQDAHLGVQRLLAMVLLFDTFSNEQ